MSAERVELRVAGRVKGLERLEQLVREGPPGAVIERVDARRGPATGEFTRFSIVRS